MRERYVFTSLPSERRGFNIRMEDGDAQILREGTCAYLGFATT